MARLFDDGSSQYLQNGSAPITAYPFAMACRFRCNDVINLQSLIWVGDKDVDAYYSALFMNGAAGGDPVLAFSGKYGLAANQSAASVTGITVDTWHHAAGIFLTTNERHAYIDGGNKGSDTDTVGAIANHDSVAIGGARDSTPAYYMSGDIAEAAIWDLTAWGASDAERETNFEKAIASMAKGFTPAHFPLGLVAYWPLIRDDNDRVGGIDLSAYNGPTISAHPEIFNPFSSLFLGATIVAAPVSLDGISQGVSSVSGELVLAVPLVSSSQGSSSISGAATVLIHLDGLSQETLSVLGVLNLSVPLASVSQGTSSILGELILHVSLVGVSQEVSSTSGALTVDGTPLVGISQGISSILGVLILEGVFTGLSAATLSTLGSLTFRTAGFYESLANQISAYFETNVAEALNIPVRYDNDPRKTPNALFWIEYSIDFGTATQFEIGVNSSRHVGNINVRLKHKVGIGIGRLLDIADQINTLFKVIEINDIIFRVPRVVNTGRVGDDYQLSVICPFQVDN